VHEGKLTREEIARAVGVTRGTLQRWLRMPEFRRVLAELGEEAVARAKQILAANAARAARRLVAALSQKGAAGVRAAVEILNRTCGDPTKATGVQVNMGAMPHMVTVRCDDGVVTLPADIFTDVKPRVAPGGEPLPWRVRLTRTQYVRLVFARRTPGTPEPFSSPDDHRNLDAVLAEDGEAIPPQLPDDDEMRAYVRARDVNGVRNEGGS